MSLESNRRVIGRGILQHYITDDEQGGTPSLTSSLTNLREFPISGNIGDSYIINGEKYIIGFIKEEEK